MAQVSKIGFSEEELNAITHPDFFYVKNSAMQKVMEVLSALHGELKVRQDQFPFVLDFTKAADGKIFRGENYLLLPYTVLDFPRHFSTSSVFAFRSMFWWGKEFSFTLHLQGLALETFMQQIVRNVATLRGLDFYFGVGTTPWQYHFGEDNYQPLDACLTDPKRFQKELVSKEFVKLSRRIPITHHSDVSRVGSETFVLLMKMLKGL